MLLAVTQEGDMGWREVVPDSISQGSHPEVRKGLETGLMAVIANSTLVGEDSRRMGPGALV